MARFIQGPQLGDRSGGTAQWATAHLARRLGYCEPGGLLLGHLDNGRAFRLPDHVANQGVLCVGVNGAGKTARSVIPALVDEARHARTLIVADPRLDLFCRTAPLLRATHAIQVWAPLRPEISLRYDPLAHVRSSLDAHELAMGWIDATGRNTEQRFFDDMEQELIMVTAAYLQASPVPFTVQRLREFLSRKTAEEMLAALRGYVEKHAHDAFVADTLGTLQRLTDNTELAGNVLAGLARRFACLRSPEVGRTTAGNDLDFAALVAQPTVLYVSIPFAEARLLAPLSATFFATLLKRLHENPDTHRPLPRSVRLYLDEFANIGRIPNFNAMQTTLRFKGVSIIALVQNLAQNEALYGKEAAAAILASFTTTIALSGLGEADARYFSDRLGTTTVRDRRRTREGAGWLFGGRRSTQDGWRARPLMTPDEVRRLDPDRPLIISGNLPPVRSYMPLAHTQRPITELLDRARASLPAHDPALAETISCIDPLFRD